MRHRLCMIKSAEEKQWISEQAGARCWPAKTSPAAEAEREAARVSMLVCLRGSRYGRIELQWRRDNRDCTWRPVTDLFLTY